jgi:hypothetical protein
MFNIAYGHVIILPSPFLLSLLFSVILLLSQIHSVVEISIAAACRTCQSTLLPSLHLIKPSCELDSIAESARPSSNYKEHQQDILKGDGAGYRPW